MLVFVIVVVVDMTADALVLVFARALRELAACKTLGRFTRLGRFLVHCELQEGSPVPPGTVRSTFGMHIQTPRVAGLIRMVFCESRR